MTVAGWVVALLAAAAPASEPVATPSIAAKAEAGKPFWDFRNGRLTHVPTGMTFPERVGEQTFDKIGILSHRGEGLDDALQYQTPGRESFTTLFVFKPSLADAGIEAAMVDAAVRRVYGDGTRVLDDRIVAVGGKPGVARRVLYEGLVMKGRTMWSGAATMKVGTWLVGVRVSGPVEKKAELEAALQGLLEQISFSTKTPPQPFHAIAFTDCPAPPDRPAARAAEVKPADAVDFGLRFLLLDTLAPDKPNGRSVQSGQTRVPDRLCRAPIAIRGGTGLRLWPADDKLGAIGDIRIAELVLLDDAGKLIEVSQVNQPNQPWYITLQGVGGARVIGALDARLSEAQLNELAMGELAVSPPKWRMSYTVDAWGNSKFSTPPLDDAPAPAAAPKKD